MPQHSIYWCSKMSEDDLNKFLKKFECTAELSRDKRYARRPRSIPNWRDSYAIDHINYSVEPMVEINMPQHRFDELIEQERYHSYLEDRAEHDAMIVQRLREDERVRDDNPAVQKAYRNYLMLLELARR